MNDRIIGFDKNNVKLVDHNPRWSVLYVAEAAAVTQFLGHEVIQIDHYGSTSIASIKAKPVIDILIQTATGEPTDEICSKFSANGYQMKTFPERIEKLFYKEENGLRTFNVHLAKHGSDFAKNMILFRDILRTKPELAKDYEAIKLEEAKNNPADSQAYYHAKKHFFKKATGWDY